MEAGLVKLNPELMALIHDKGGTDIIPFKQEIFVINVFVAGTGYCEKIAEVQEYLSPGMQLTMRRHPENEVDELPASCSRAKSFALNRQSAGQRSTLVFTW